MDGGQIKYVWTDAWVLQAVIYASKNGGADLRNIIAFGDTINQAVFRPEELESGLYRLAKGGWIEDLGKKFQPSQKTRAAYAEIPKDGWSLVQEMELVAEFLGLPNVDYQNQPCPNPENRFSYPGFTEARFDAAVKKYRAGEP